MLTSITPLGERGRNNRWVVTVIAHVVGGAVGGVALGALLGGAGTLPAEALGRRGSALALAVSALVALLFDVSGAPIPGLRRQVNEDWLTQYRGWVYGAGFGVQLGVAFATIITSAATWLAAIAAFLSGSVRGGALVMGAFGLVRGLAPLVTVGVRDRNSLMRLGGRLAAWARPARLAVIAMYPVVTAVAVWEAAR